MTGHREHNLIHGAMERSLSGLQGDPTLEARVLAAGKRSAQLRRFPAGRLLLIPALLALMLTGAFAAERLGLFDMLLNSSQKDVQPEAEQLVTTPVILHATNTDHAILRVLESLRSGSDVLLTVEAEPKAAGILLTPDSLLGSGGASGAYRVRFGFDWADADALLDHAESTGKQLLALGINLHTPERTGSSPHSESLPYEIVDGRLMENGGVQLLLYLSDDVFKDTAADATLQLRFSTTPVVRSPEAPDYALQTLYTFNEAERSAAFMTLTLPATQQLAPLLTLAAEDSAMPLLLDDASVRIDAVTLTGTPLYTRYEVTYTYLHAQAQEVYFFLCNETGQRLTGGIRGGSVPYGEWPTYTRVGYASALSGVPEEIHLQVMTFFSVEPLTTVTIPVTVVAEAPAPAGDWGLDGSLTALNTAPSTPDRQMAAPTPAP